MKGQPDPPGRGRQLRVRLAGSPGRRSLGRDSDRTHRKVVKVHTDLRYNGSMVTVNTNPIAIKFIVVDLPTDDDLDDVGPSPQAVREATQEVRTALNRWYYTKQCNSDSI